MAKRVLILAVLLGIGVLFWRLASGVDTAVAPGSLARRYVGEAPETLGAQNVVTAVVVTYRGLDTLGEVVVLFIAATGVGFLLRRRKTKVIGSTKRPASEILQTGADVLLPLILVFGSYIFMHGHLTPGGGFQGGVVLATAVLLLILAGSSGVGKTALSAVESLSGLGYVLLGTLGVLIGAGLLDSRILPVGSVGELLSAGAIPLIYSFVGLKVGAELTGILTEMGGQS